jgi:hypothetical protein
MKPHGCVALAALFVAVSTHAARAQFLQPLLSPETKARTAVVKSFARFFRSDAGPRYIIDAHPEIEKQGDLTKAQIHAFLDDFAAAAPQLACRTDDVADAAQFAIESAMLVFGKQIPGTSRSDALACEFPAADRSHSFTDFMVMDGVNTLFHIAIGARMQAKTDAEKQLVYELLVLDGEEIIRDAQSRDPRRVALAKKYAAQLILSVTGARQERVHYTPSGGLAIDDQYRPAPAH